jgi:hypothetical protein
MGRPTRQQIEAGLAFEHTDQRGNVLHVADTFQKPLLEFRVQVPGRGHRHLILDLDAVEALADYLDRWLLKYPPREDD